MLIGALVIAAIAAVIYWPQNPSDKAGITLPDVAIDRFTLSNGMVVILVPNDRVPAISHTLWLKVGAADDPMGKSGLAHYLEHLMFKGTEKVPSGDYSRQIERLGGNHNAFTSSDFTGYYVNIAREHLEEVMKLEADRWQHLTISDAEWQQEREVILEERRSRIDNSPQSILNEQMNAVQYYHHPYRIPIIGWKHEMERLTKDDALEFYRNYYHPANMFLVVAGDITRAELEPMAERYYGAIPTGTHYARRWVQEPEQLAARQLSVKHPLAQQRQWVRSYVAPSLNSGDKKQALPLLLLTQWLGGGQTGLLYQELVVKQQLATSAGASFQPFSYGPSELTLYATPRDGVSMSQISKAVTAVIDRLALEPIDAATLKRVQSVLQAEAIYARDGLETVAQFCGYLEAVGLPLDYYSKWIEWIGAVTADEISAATQVFDARHSVTGFLLPETKPVSLSPDRAAAAEDTP